jgi:hypothetical protein
MILFGIVGLAVGLTLVLESITTPVAVVYATLIGVVTGATVDVMFPETLTPADLADARWYRLGEYSVRYDIKRSKNGNKLQYIFYAPDHPDRENGHIEIT